ncbi:unnamed protein product, partial [marine sediment metagenome]
KNVLESFVDTSSVEAGLSVEEDDPIEPKNFGQAIRMIKERDKIEPKEASEKAKVEFKELFDAMYPEKEE